MKTLAVLMFVLAGVAYSNPIDGSCPNCFTGPTGHTLKPIDECKQADKCAIFGGWRVGNFRVSSDDTVYVQCTGTKVHHCQRCPRDNQAKDASEEYLVFNEYCNMCIRRGEECQPITYPPTGTPIPTVAYDEDFCKHPPRNGEKAGNFVDPEHETWYYACVYHVTYHQPCAAGQFYNATCDACMKKNTVHLG